MVVVKDYYYLVAEGARLERQEDQATDIILYEIIKEPKYVHVGDENRTDSRNI